MRKLRAAHGAACQDRAMPAMGRIRGGQKTTLRPGPNCGGPGPAICHAAVRPVSRSIRRLWPRFASHSTPGSPRTPPRRTSAFTFNRPAVSQARSQALDPARPNLRRGRVSRAAGVLRDRQAHEAPPPVKNTNPEGASTNAPGPALGGESAGPDCTPPANGCACRTSGITRRIAEHSLATTGAHRLHAAATSAADYEMGDETPHCWLRVLL